MRKGYIIVADPAWGMKRHCLSSSCNAIFYDFDRRPITCPLCQASFAPEDFFRNRRQRSTTGRFDSATKAEGSLLRDDDDLENDNDEVESFTQDDSLNEEETLSSDMVDSS